MSDQEFKFPDAPSTLNGAGKLAWQRGKSLWIEGNLVERDLAAWLTYCKAFDEIAHCEALVALQGEYATTKNGAICQHPAISRRVNAEKTVWRYEKAFGLVPDARRKKPAVQQGVATRKR